MQDVLLVGNNNEMMNELYQCLHEEYQVQLCTKDLAQIQSTIDIVKPCLVFLCLFEQQEQDEEIIRYIRNNTVGLPLLMVGSQEACKPYQQYESMGQGEFEYSPLSKMSILKHCRHLLQEDEFGIREEDYIYSDGRQILVCDDSPIILRNLKSILDVRYDVHLAKSGEQLFQILASQQVDLILLDYEMPDMDGSEVFMRLKRSPKWEKIPVIFLTGVSDRENVMRVMKLKPKGYLLKPISGNRLLAMIEEALW